MQRGRGFHHSAHGFILQHSSLSGGDLGPCLAAEPFGARMQRNANAIQRMNRHDFLAFGVTRILKPREFLLQRALVIQSEPTASVATS